jgi:hypothetical protein
MSFTATKYKEAQNSGNLTLKSISLAVPRLQIQMVPTKTGQYCFELITNERQKTNIFGVKKKQEIKTTKYEFKCISESEMIEWIACIQNNISKLIPSGPPEPLFKTQKQIEENVEELMKGQNQQLLEKYPDHSEFGMRSNTSVVTLPHYETEERRNSMPERSKSMSLPRKSLDNLSEIGKGKEFEHEFQPRTKGKEVEHEFQARTKGKAQEKLQVETDKLGSLDRKPSIQTAVSIEY